MSTHTADRFAIARSLREIGQLLAVRGESRYRALAYERGADALEGLGGDLDQRLREGTLTDTPGIGRALASEIATLHETGRSPLLERLRRELPPGILDLVRVPGLGLGRIARLYRELGVGSLDELRQACELGRVRTVEGFGAVSERKLLEAVRRAGEDERRLLLHRALEEVEPLVAHLRASPDVARAEIGGPLRRGVEAVSRLDLVAQERRRGAVADALTAWPRLVAQEPRAQGLLAQLAPDLELQVSLAEPDGFAETWLHATGSDAHVAKLLALPRRAEDAGQGEAALYASRGLPWIPPELREDAGEIEHAVLGTLPTDLVTLADLRGFVHCHTSWSDGRASIEEMARAAEAAGAEYLTVTDHSRSASYAGGLDLDRLKAQGEEIARVQERVGIRLLRGTESDILADGALDYPDEVLAELDVVVASLHTRHGLDAQRTTERIVRALRHPLFKIWGHALGRLIGERAPVACDVRAVLDAAAESRVAIEVNGDPRRLDMEPHWLREARQRGFRFVISTDAHAPRELRNARYGVITARRGWLRRSEVLNTLGFEHFRDAVRPAP